MADLGVVVIGRNEGERLARCLASVSDAGPLVYVDSGSTDGSAALAQARGVPVLELTPDRPFCAARARNEGFAALLAREPGLAFVQFLDADCELAPGWLAAGRAALLARPPAAVACGRLRERAPDASLYNRLCQVEWNVPPGTVDACGGVFLARAEDFAAVGGMDPRVVAAEEDDFCVRLRLRGREILRIDADMATHDAAMERLAQWWSRSMRTGQAYAQVSALHRGAPIRPFAREARSALLLGLAAPLAIAALAAATRGAALLLLALYLPLVARVARRLRARGESPRDAWLYAAHCYAAKVPQAQGVLRYALDRLRRRPARLIEHKGEGAARGAAASPPALRVGFLGAGYIADWHRRALRFVPEARIAAVCDRAPGRAEALAAAVGATAYATLGEMLRAEPLDAVHVLVPPDQHFAAAREILAAGVAVLLEKPMCTTAEECAELERIAERNGVRLAVSQNFLFDPSFERLVHDVRAGRLGPLDALHVTWNRELPILRAAPPGAWMLAEPGNILLEIGSHLLAHVVEVAGVPVDLAVRADREITLPGGRRFVRRWRIDAVCGPTAVAVEACFAPGFPEYRVHARGALGAATADLERGTYTFEHSSRAAADLARFAGAIRTATALAAQTARGVVDAALAKAGALRPANPFEASIAGALRAFYAGLARPGELDPRIAAARGRTVVELGLAIGARAGAPAGPIRAPRPRAARDLACETLVLGGNGFIGRALVRRLLEDGATVRVLSRTAAGVPEEAAGLDVALGSRNDAAALDAALRGVRVVYDLARSQGPTWEDFEREDVAGARLVGERCLAHGVERLVYASTIDGYYAGAAESTITEATPLDARIATRNLYAQAKVAAETALAALQERGLSLVIARPGIVIGRGASPMHGGVGEWSGLGAVATYGAGDAPLPLVLVDDCADALARMKDRPGLDGRSFNLVGPPLLTARGYLDALERVGHLALRRTARPIWRFYAADVAKWLVKVAVRHPGRSRRPSRRDFASRTFRARFDASAARRELGWSPCDDAEELIARGIAAPLAELLEG
ncbi:MAG TPA: Gfo/Idh/MocA family oxidoreductase [Myxococcota bacterium]|nr:Gfo/Idh/MocA family oxidoreductase [Myxococcota bacterium]